MATMGMEVSALGVARIYQELVDVLVIDTVDADLAPAIEKLGMKVVVTNTMMTGLPVKKALARTVVKALQKFRA